VTLSVTNLNATLDQNSSVSWHLLLAYEAMESICLPIRFKQCKYDSSLNLSFSLSAFVETLMNTVASLQFHDVPDYNHFRAIFQTVERSAPANDISTVDDDDEVVLCLRMERTSGAGDTSRKPTETAPATTPTSPTPKKQKLKISPKRFGLRFAQRQTSEVEPEPEMPTLPNPEVIAEAEFEAARARQEKEMSDATLLNPTPAMVEQMNRIKMRSILGASDIFGGRRRER
jgi:hypothetical protein